MFPYKETKFDQLQTKTFSPHFSSTWEKISQKWGKEIGISVWAPNTPFPHLFDSNKIFKDFIGFKKDEDFMDIYIDFIIPDHEVIDVFLEETNEEEYILVEFQTVKGKRRVPCVACWYWSFLVVLIFDQK